jgi:hypothetical protein
MELVRYRPGEAIRWLQTGAENLRKGAQAKGKVAVTSGAPDARAFGENLKTAAGALLEYSRSAYADLMHRQAEASEYVLHDDYFDVVRGSNIKTVQYSRVTATELDKDRALLTLDKGSLTVKPFAHLVAGRVRVPIGWSRNGIEVPFELLIEELAARCGIELEEK